MQAAQLDLDLDQGVTAAGGVHIATSAGSGRRWCSALAA
jgi:hypothetical protein